MVESADQPVNYVEAADYGEAAHRVRCAPARDGFGLAKPRPQQPDDCVFDVCRRCEPRIPGAIADFCRQGLIAERKEAFEAFAQRFAAG